MQNFNAVLDHLPIPKIIHQTSAALTWEEKHLINFNKTLMPSFTFNMWSDEQNAALFEKHFPHLINKFKGFDRGVIRADISRCLYLYEFGGIYCDTDYRFYKPLDDNFLANHCVLGLEDTENAAIGGGKKVGNALMASEAGFSLWPEFIESTFSRSDNGEQNVLFLGGPHALSIFLRTNRQYAENITILDQDKVYPDFTFMGIKTKRDGDTIGAHYCWGSWRNKSFFQATKSRTRRILSAIL